MSVFTESSFRRYLNRLIAIHPLRDASITGVGYDLTVGLYAHVDPVQKVITAIGTLEGPQPSQISIEPNCYLIVISREHVYLSSKVAATFHSKSSLAAQAVFLNSTTGDPNWSGRLIFSLYNASGINVNLDFDTTFATMVVHKTERPSKLRPKESKTVIDKYLRGLTGEHDKIVGYVMRENEYTEEFERQKENVKCLAALSTPGLEIWISVGTLVQNVRKHRVPIVVACSVVFFASLLAMSLPDRPTLTMLAEIAAILSLLVALLGLLLKR